MKKTLTSTEVRYKRLFKTTHLGILILACKDHKITDVNPFFTKLTGFPAGSLIGKKISQVGLFEGAITGKRIFDELELEDEVLYENTILITKNGHKKIVEVVAHVYKEGEHSMVQCTIRDLTEKRKAQRQLFESNQRLDALMNALPVGVTFSLDPKCELIEVNPYMRKKMEMEGGAHITATNDETFIIGHEYRHFKNGKQLKPRELPLQRAIAENRLVGPIEAEVELPSGKRWNAEAYGAPIRDPQGKVIGAVAVNVDLTERRRAEETEKLALILKKEKEKLDFIADATHELRTPLAIIRGNVDLALQKKTSPTDALSAINAEVLHLTSLLSDLSLLTTKEGDFKKNMSSHEVDIGRIVANLAQRHKGLASEKNISIKVAKLPRTKIVGDEYYLERLFTNILTNAISYGKESGHIEVSGSSDKKWVRIYIKDDGVGISEKNLPHIFERFYRAEESRSKDFGGSGLGLAIVKWIAEAHGGTVEATSTLGKGSVFTVSFPIPKKK